MRNTRPEPNAPALCGLTDWVQKSKAARRRGGRTNAPEATPLHPVAWSRALAHNHSWITAAKYLSPELGASPRVKSARRVAWMERSNRQATTMQHTQPLSGRLMRSEAWRSGLTTELSDSRPGGVMPASPKQLKHAAEVRDSRTSKRGGCSLQ